MARRVNTKFVVILSVALGGAVVLALGVKGYSMLQARNPDVVTKRGEDAEKAGNPKLAVDNYRSAAGLLAWKHQAGADAMYARAADLCMKISREADKQEDAARYYQSALDLYRQASRENPLNKAVNETLLEEDYLKAQYFGSVEWWKTVEEDAVKLIKNQDGTKARQYHAEARLYLLQFAPDTATPAALAQIDQDLDQALQFDPRSGPAVALRAELIWFKMRLSASRRGLITAGEYYADPQVQKSLVEGREMLIHCLAGKWVARPGAPGWTWFARIPLDHVNSDVAAELAKVCDNKTAIALLEAARSAAPDNPSLLADRLGQLYVQTGSPEKAEDLYKQIIQKTPERPDAYFRLATFYRARGQFPDAIKFYLEVANPKHAFIGSGREAEKNLDYQILAVEGIGALNLELAELPGATPEDFKKYMKDAADATDRLRAMHGPAGMVFLLDGRAQLIDRDYPHAMATLRQAEANLSRIPRLADRCRQTELLLSRANEEQNQLGAALEWVDKALGDQVNKPDVRREDVGVFLNKGRLLLRLARFSEARILMERILGKKPDGTYANEDALGASVTDAAKNILALADAEKRPDEASRSFLDRGELLNAALTELNAEDYEDAAAHAAQALEKSAGDSDAAIAQAFQVVISSNIQLKKNDEAKKWAAQALQKFPQNASFQLFKAQLDRPEGADSLEARKEIINAITDEYLKALNLASLYHRERLWDDEIGVLQKARESYKNASAPEDRERLNAILDRLFLASMTAAGQAKEDAKREDYWKAAQALVTDIEKLDLDGTDGKIYRGQLELARTNGQNGLQYLQQAVAQRPDYAQAHLMLGQAYFALAALNAAKGAAASTTNAASALEEFRTTIRLAPNNIAALQNAIRLLLGKGDSSSLKEAQGYIESGLAVAPHNSVFISDTEFFPDKIDDSIVMRTDLLARNPDDRDNLRRLAVLYVGKKDREADPEKKQQAMDRAIALLDADYQKHKEELAAGDLLARILVEYDKSDKGAARALGIYAAYIASPDPVVKFNALIAKAEFFRNLLLLRDSIKALKTAGLITHDDLREEAADALVQAAAIEPKDQDDAERHLADMYFDLGRMADAEQTYLKVLDKNQNPDTMDRVTRRLIEAQMRQGKFKEADPRLADLLKKQPQDIQGLILHAYSSIEQGLKLAPDEQPKALKAALTDLDLVLKLDAGNPDALFYRATAQIALGDRFDDAEKDLLQASKQDRASVNSRVLLAELYVRTQRYEEASRTYHELLLKRPELAAVRTEYVDFLRKLAELQTTLPSDSDVEFVQSLHRLDPLNLFMDEVKSASDLYPGDLRWAFLYSQALTMQGKNAEALRLLESMYKLLLDQHILDAQVCDAYYGALLKLKEYDKVAQLSGDLIDKQEGFQDFVVKNPQYVSFYLKRAAANQGLGKTDEAVKDVDRGLALSVEAAKKTGNLVPFISVLNDVSALADRAAPGTQPATMLTSELLAQRLRVRIAADPADTISKLGLIQTLLNMNQPEEALQVVDSGMTVPPEDQVLRQLVLRESAAAQLQTKHYGPAEIAFKELEKLAPNDVENLNNYAFMLADGLNRPKEAISYAQRALKLLATRSNPDQVAASSADVYDTLGWAYYMNNDFDNAIANLQKSVKVQPQSAAFLHLALAYQKTGQLVAAQQKCQEGLKLATAKHDAETLKSLEDLDRKLNPKP